MYILHICWTVKKIQRKDGERVITEAIMYLMRREIVTETGEEETLEFWGCSKVQKLWKKKLKLKDLQDSKALDFWLWCLNISEIP